MKKFPIGIQDFRTLRENDYLFIDKTEQIHKLVTSGSYFFLSRPRRFGKSLLLSTMKELFNGSRELFKDLWIEDKWNWEQKNPVLHIAFNSIGYSEIGLEEALKREVQKLSKQHDIKLTEEGYIRRFGQLVEKVAEKKGKVVLLIDEYDKPIIDYLDKSERPQAIKNQKTLKSFYSTIKSNGSFIRLLFITGVSKFSKTGIFSELNNLNDLTIDRRFADLTGYTQKELDFYFEPYREQARELNDMDDAELSAQLKYWYNGYSWDRKTFVYNPFSILNFFEKGEFMNFWFETGTPTFLIKLLKEHFYYDFQDTKVGSVAFNSYDIDNLSIEPLLFQTGYLTLKKKIRNIYLLGYPNHEVKESMLQHLIGAFRYSEPGKSSPMAYEAENAFVEGNLEEVVKLINVMFSTIPFQLWDANKEKYYHSLIHLLFTYMGIFIKSEVSVSGGRADAIVETDDTVYITEFKLDKSPEEAIAQIKEKGYANQYRNNGKKLIAFGINFSSKEKRVGDWKAETLEN